jgi:hypothetical protein
MAGLLTMLVVAVVLCGTAVVCACVLSGRISRKLGED